MKNIRCKIKEERERSKMKENNKGEQEINNN